jgi:hypothetical protein
MHIQCRIQNKNFLHINIKQGIIVALQGFLCDGVSRPDLTGVWRFHDPDEKNSNQPRGWRVAE